MSLTVVEKKQIIDEYQLSSNDTGSVEIQVALLSADIKKLTEHFKVHKHDYHSRRGLMREVNRRRKLLRYLKQTEIERYRNLIKRLNLREIQ